MAVYQFFLTVVPRKGIINLFGEIPSKLEVNNQKKIEKYLNNEYDISESIDIIEETMINCWKFSDLNPNEIITKIDKILPRAEWGNNTNSHNWKIETNKVDNDIWISTNKNLDKIEEFTFRVDLREKELKFLQKMIEIIREQDLLLIDVKGNIVKKEMKEIVRLIEISNSYQFVKNPLNFLSDLNEGKTIIE